MAVKSKSKAKLSAKVAVKAKAKLKAKLAVKPKAKTAVKKAKPVAKAKPKAKAKAKAKAKVVAKVKTVTKAKTVAKPKAKTAVKPKAKAAVKVVAKPKAKSVPKVAVKAAPKVKAIVKPQAKAQPKPTKTPVIKSKAVAQPKAIPKVKVKLEVQKTTYHPISGSGGPTDFIPYREIKNEDYMNPQQADHFRKILRDWLVQLREEVDNTMAHMQEEMGTYPDPVDRAAQEEEFSLELRARDRERKLIKKIEQAIDDIDHNDYGYCKDCGAEIGIRRLEARPTADKCIDCKTFEEIKEKQTGA